MSTPRLASLLLAASLVQVQAVDDYQPGPDSFPQPGVPAGRVHAFVFSESKIYPGTTRDVWVYIPAQYDGSRPAALMVFQDGQAYVNTNGLMRTPHVFDNLIHRGEMPVTIGLFVNPGHRGPGGGPGGRNNRSFEYDSLGDAYARFLIEELIPEAVRRYQLNLTDRPELRALCGMSSGGICAFTAAWERPEYFQKVLSHIGSFVNIRGGHVYPALIRKTERKPIRVFLQEGSNDLNNLHGDWPLANQQMASALRFAGYDVRFEYGHGAHNGRHGGAILPDSLRWLWRPQAAPPAPLTQDLFPGDEALVKILPPEGGWEEVADGYEFTDAACADAAGHFYFSDLPKGRVYRVTPRGEISVWLDVGLRISGLKPGPDGRFYAAVQGGGAGPDRKRIVAIDSSTRQVTDVAVDVQPNDLVVSPAGWIYFTDTAAGQVLMVPTSARSLSRPRVAAGGMVRPNGIVLSPGQPFLVVSEAGGRHAWSFVVAPDGSLQSGERYMELRVPEGRKESGGDGMTADSEGRYYIASHAGIQVFDSTGRMGGVILSPGGLPCVSLAFAGEGRQWLYACGGGKVWRRKTLAQGPPAVR